MGRAQHLHEMTPISEFLGMCTDKHTNNKWSCSLREALVPSHTF